MKLFELGSSLAVSEDICKMMEEIASNCVCIQFSQVFQGLGGGDVKFVLTQTRVSNSLRVHQASFKIDKFCETNWNKFIQSSGSAASRSLVNVLTCTMWNMGSNREKNSWTPGCVLMDWHFKRPCMSLPVSLPYEPYKSYCIIREMVLFLCIVCHWIARTAWTGRRHEKTIQAILMCCSTLSAWKCSNCTA